MTEDFSTQVRNAWQRQERRTLVDLLGLGHGNQWRQRALEFIEVMTEVNAPVTDVLNLMPDINRVLRYQWTNALMWRIFATPRVLQLQGAAAFGNVDLVAATAGVELPISWSNGAKWVGQWPSAWSITTQGTPT